MKKVSLVVPCYNGEKYLGNFFDSVLAQDYENIEIIFIDDGSTDNTKSISNKYERKFTDKGYTFHYVYQKNSGQAAALNKGLKMVTGEYLMWPDSDDILLFDNISSKVDYLEKYKDRAIVFSKGIMVDENDINNKLGEIERKHKSRKDNIFADYIHEKNVIFAPISYMVRVSCLDEAIADRTIYEGRQGQNWQMILPLVYKYQWGYIDRVLFKYVVHTDSHSHEKRTYEEKIERCNGFEAILINTIQNINDMPETEKEFWYKDVRTKYLRKKMYLEYALGDSGKYISLKRELYNLNGKNSVMESKLACFFRKKIYGEAI